MRKCGKRGLDPYDLCMARCERTAGHRGRCDVAYPDGGHGPCERNPGCEKQHGHEGPCQKTVDL